MIRLFVFSWLYIMSTISLACYCAYEDNSLEDAVKKSLHTASSVVLARAILIKKNEATFSSDEPFPPDADMGGDITQFNEIQSWKGEHGKSFHTRINTKCCMCGYSFQEGESYLLYLYGPNEEGFYSTSVCSRTKPAGDAEKEIAILNHVAPNNSMQPTRDASAD